MKRADLRVGEFYAFAYGREPSHASKVELVSLVLHESRRHVAGYVPAPEGAKARRGSGYFESTRGYLVRKDDGGGEQLAQPAELHMRWADWEVHKAAKDAAAKVAAEASDKERSRREEQARRLASELAGSRWAGLVRVDRYRAAQSVPNDVLLEMLSAARVSS